MNIRENCRGRSRGDTETRGNEAAAVSYVRLETRLRICPPRGNVELRAIVAADVRRPKSRYVVFRQPRYLGSYQPQGRPRCRSRCPPEVAEIGTRKRLPAITRTNENFAEFWPAKFGGEGAEAQRSQTGECLARRRRAAAIASTLAPKIAAYVEGSGIALGTKLTVTLSKPK
jgi:hypothetical protein